MLVGAPRRALDVGAGTGKLARLLLERGVDVTGVEPDERMAAVARGHGVRVEVAAFESWDAAGRRFPLLVSGQAWHWVDPVAGAAKAAAVIEPGGVWAALWNFASGEADEAVRHRLDEVYAALAPQAARLAIGTRADDPDDPMVDALDATGCFGPVERLDLAWETTVDPVVYAERLSTHSDHLLLPAATRDALLAATVAALPAEGVVVRGGTIVLRATRR